MYTIVCMHAFRYSMWRVYIYIYKYTTIYIYTIFAACIMSPWFDVAVADAALSVTGVPTSSFETVVLAIAL